MRIAKRIVYDNEEHQISSESVANMSPLLFGEGGLDTDLQK